MKTSLRNGVWELIQSAAESRRDVAEEENQIRAELNSHLGHWCRVEAHSWFFGTGFDVEGIMESEMGATLDVEQGLVFTRYLQEPATGVFSFFFVIPGQTGIWAVLSKDLQDDIIWLEKMPF